MLQKQAKLQALAESSKRPKWMRNRINFYNRYMTFLFDAPVLMAVAAIRPKELVTEQESLFGAGLEQMRIMNLHMTSGLAVMNYLLKGESLGLGSCIMSAPLIFLEEPEELLGLEGMEMICFITTGYPDEEAKPIKRKTMEEVYHCK
jgi:nitroreductase